MPFYIFYLLKLSVSLTIVWLFYRLFLQRLTFYSWNRWYLLIYSLLSFVMPLVNITPWVEKHSFREDALINYIPVLPNAQTRDIGLQPLRDEATSFFASGWDILPVILIAGAGVLLIRLLVRIWSFQKIRRNARLMDNGESAAVKLYHVEGDIIPFSFGNAIYINQHLHTEKEWEEIILHEYVHVRQRHTIDILVAEWLCILNWYNPFAWLIRFSIRQNLEFIADNKVLENGSDRKAYQYLLLKVVGSQPYRIANSFNFSSLKKRIIMMNRIKSARIQLVKFLFLLPLMAVLLLAFRNRYEDLSARPGNSSAPDAGNALLPGDTGISVSGRPDSSPFPDGRNTTAEKRDTAAPENNDAVSVKQMLQKLGSASPVSDGRDTLAPGIRSSGGSSGKSPGWDSLPLPQNMLYILDGKQMPPNWTPKSVPSSSIESMDVLKGETATDLFGARAANGVIWITTLDSATAKPRLRITYGTKKVVNPQPDSVVLISADQKERWVQGYKSNDLEPRTVVGHRSVEEGISHIVIGHEVTGEGRHRPIIYVDGVEIDSAQFSKVPRDQIQTVTVLKDKAAMEKYGEKAKNGVIVVTLKKPVGAIPGKASGMAVRFDSTSHKPAPLFVLNGREIDSAQVVKIPASALDSIMVLTDNDAISRYGEKGRYGVVQLHLKEPTMKL